MEIWLKEINIYEKFLTDELSSRIIESVVKDGAKRKGTHSHMFYSRIINIPIPGFRPNTKPPIKIVITEANNQIRKNDRAYMLLLLAWKEMNSVLLDKWAKLIRDTLDSKPDITSDAKALSEAAELIYSNIELSDKDKLTEEECKLLIVLGLVMADDEEDKGEIDESKDRELTEKGLGKWTKVIEEINLWEPASKEWEDVELFMQHVRQIAEEKSEGRLKELNAIDELLNKTRQRTEEILYFGLNKVDEWAAADVNKNKCAAVIEKLNEFEQLLTEANLWIGRDEKTIQERREKNKKLEELEKQTKATYQELLVGYFDKSAEDEKPDTKKIISDVDSVKNKTADGDSIVDIGFENKPETPLGDLEVENVKKQVESVEVDLGSDINSKGAVEERTNVVAVIVDVKEKKPDDNCHVEVKQTNISSTDTAETQPDQNESVDVSNALDEKICELIITGDLPAAYLLAEAIEKTETKQALFPSWLIGSVQGAHWMIDAERPFITDLREIAFAHEPDSCETPHHLLGLSAAMITSLLAPSIGMLHWLNHKNEQWPSLYNLTKTIAEYSEMGVPLMREEFHGTQSAADVTTKINECVRKAISILDESVKQKYIIKRARKIILSLYGTNGYLYGILKIIANNEHSKMDAIVGFLNNWEKPSFVEREINIIDAKLGKFKNDSIVGKAKEQLLRYIDQTVQFVRQWHDLQVLNKQIVIGSNRKNSRTTKFFNDYKKWAPEVSNELKPLVESSNTPKIIAAAGCLLKTIDLLGYYVGLAELPSYNKDYPEPKWWVEDTTSLYESLGQRLLWFADIETYDNFTLDDSDNEKLIGLLVANTVDANNIYSVIKQLIDKQDYRFIDKLKKSCFDSDKIDEMEMLFVEAFEGSKATLQKKTQAVKSVVEKAIINGIISDEDRDEYSETISMISLDNTMNFNNHYNKLNEIQVNLEAALELRVSDLTQRWGQVKAQLKADTRTDKGEKKSVESFIDKEFLNKNTRVIEECLAKLTEYLEKGERFSFADFNVKRKNSLFKEYVEERKKIENNIVVKDAQLNRLIKAVEEGHTWSAIKFGEMPKPHLQQAGAALRNWLKLTKDKSRIPETIFAVMLKDIFSFIGFSFDRGLNVVERVRREDNWQLFKIKMSSSDFARPFPQLGSMTNGNYDVICVWEKPGADFIGGLLHDSHLEAKNLIILYFGRMTDYQIRELRKMARKRRIVAAVLDEILLIYLMGVREERLKAFLHCSLPNTAINPYTPYMPGDVPPEMFYGREEVIRDLQLVDGGCLVYGGRQMGKSALLRHVMRRFNNPQLNHYAWVEDIKNIGDSLTGIESEQIWLKVRDVFAHYGLIKSSTLSKRDSIRARISQVMKDNSDLRVLLMFDEADKFLNNDAQNDFREVDEFRRLMSETSRRLKIIFTGLHHVQRFQNLPNQPLAHFGYPSSIGPLEPADASSLVREPLEALGYTLDEACVFGILSYTNYHPGLIQIFCHELVKRLYSQGNQKENTITLDEIEAVYLNEEVRAKIKERFEWTLALDYRYQVIACAMIFEQIDIKDSYAQTYKAGELLELVKQFWPAAFTAMAVDNFRNLLNEMRGLGVLVETSNNEYRLRSPNLVRLMGTETDILYKLNEFIDKPSEIQTDPESFHSIIDETEIALSPLTFAQVRNINSSSKHVGVITASPALGLMSIEKTLSKLINSPKGGNQAGIQKIPDNLLDGQSLNNWLSNSLGKNDDADLTLYQFVEGHSKGLEERIQTSQNFIKEKYYKSKRKELRVFFIIDPAAYWELIMTSSEIFSDLEEQGSIIKVARWNTLGIQHMLELTGKINNDDVINKLLQGTGGWPLLLEEVFKRTGRVDDPRFAVDSLQDEMKQTGKLRAAFINGVGLMVDTKVIEVYKYIAANDDITEEFVTPDFIESEQVLNEFECMQALRFLTQYGLVEDTNGIIKVEPYLSMINSFGVTQ